MIEHPYFLLLLMFIPVYFYYRNVTKYYFRHAYLDSLRSNAGKVLFRWQNLIFLGCIFLTFAACGFTWKSKEIVKSYIVHKYVLVNDGSGSMVNNSKENGIGNELNAILSGNARLFDFLGKRNDGSKDLVGAIVFADDAFTVSNLSDDHYFVQKKLSRIDYRLSPLSGGTNIEAGLWAGLEMLLLSHNDLIKQSDLDHLQLRFYGNENRIKKDKFIESIVTQRESFTGESIIIFTDGIFDANGHQKKMSSFKIIDFCKLIGIRVYFISILNLDSNLIKHCKETGGRGDIVQGFNKRKLEQIYEEIVVSQASEHIVKEQVVDRSLSDLFALIGIVAVLIGIIFHSTTQLNFTEV